MENDRSLVNTKGFKALQRLVFNAFRVILVVFGVLLPLIGGAREANFVVFYVLAAIAMFTATRLKGPDGANMIEQTSPDKRYVPTVALPFMIPAFAYAIGLVTA